MCKKSSGLKNTKNINRREIIFVCEDNIYYSLCESVYVEIEIGI